jgi:hypothetical protein
MYFDRKFEFKKNHRNSYIRPLSIADLKYGRYDQEIRSFSQFLLQTCDFR